MRPLRIAATVLMLLGAISASAQCVSAVRDITGQFPPLDAGPIAWNGSVLAIGGIQRSTGAIWITLADEHGNPLYPRFRLSESEGSTPYAILTNGSEFSVWFRDAAGNMRMRRVSTTGAFIGEPIYAIDDDFFIHANDRVDVTWSSALDAYVLVRTVTTTNPRELWMSIINVDGTTRSMARLATDVGPDSLLRVAVTEAPVIGIFYEAPNGTVRLMRIEAGFRNLQYDVWTPGGDDLVVVARDNQFVLARSYSDSFGSHIRWKTISTHGDELARESILVEGSGEDIRAVSLLARDGELALTYLDAPAGFELQRPRYRLLRFLPSGPAISDTFFAAADPGRRRAATEFDFVWTGSAYVSAGLDTEVDESYLLRYCPLAPHIVGPRFVHRGTTATFSGHASGGVPPYTFVWRFPGGGTVFTQDVSLTFTEVGQMTFELTVTDATGAQSTQFFTVDIVEPPPPPPPPQPGRRRAVRH